MPSVTLDSSVLDAVEEHPSELVVKVEDVWAREGYQSVSATRWLFQKAGSGPWWAITEYPNRDNDWVGRCRSWLEPPPEPFRPEGRLPIETGELYHISCAPQEVQLWVAGFRPDVAECSQLRESGGVQQSVTHWSD